MPRAGQISQIFSDIIEIPHADIHVREGRLNKPGAAVRQGAAGLEFHCLAGQHDPLGHLLDLSGKAAAEKVLSLLFLQKAL